MIAAIYARQALAVRAPMILALAMVLGGCADRTIRLAYTPPTAAQSLAPRLVVGPFQDVRGNEGDHGDVYRVGGVYGGYGNRLAKVVVTSPWPPALAAALVAEFRAQGVDAIAGEPSTADIGAYRLGGDVRNFSTEARWGREAHIGITLRLRSPDGRQLVEKRVDVRENGYNLNNFDGELLEELMNRAFARFVRDVAADAEIRAALR